MSRGYRTKAMVAGLLTMTSLIPTAATAANGMTVGCLSQCGAGYNAFGFVAVANGSAFVVARRGTRHQNDLTGRVAFYRAAGFEDGNEKNPPASGLAQPTPPTWWDGVPARDTRNLAGGMTVDGRLVFFWAARDRSNQWEYFESVVMRPPTVAATSLSPADNMSPIPTGGDVVFSPYGPLISMPSGRVMQTFYGVRADGTARIRTLSSNLTPNVTNGVITWDDEHVVDASSAYRASETAAVRIDGATDATSRLVAVARTTRSERGSSIGVLRQYVSADGGRSWRNLGEIPASKSTGEVMPWIAQLADGRLALVWADRGSLTIKVSLASPADAFSSALAWSPPRDIYNSALQWKPPAERRLSDFGYPSIALLHGKPIVAFYDAAISVDPAKDSASTTIILAMPLAEHAFPTPFVAPG